MSDEEQPLNEMETILTAGMACAGAEARRFDVDGIPMMLLDGTRGTRHARVLDEALRLADERATTPRRREGQSSHHELDSFCAYVNRFKCEHSVVWADLERAKVLAILNYHPKGPEPDSTGWGDHRAQYLCPLSPQWVKRSGINGKPMTQVDFAEFIDENLHDLGGGKGTEYPEPMKILEMARQLAVYTKGTHKRTIHPTTGDHELVCSQETTSNSTPIPRAFELRIPVFQGGELWSVEVRIQLRIREGQAVFTLNLHRVVELEREAFGEVCTKVAEAVDLPLFAGTPEG